MNVNLINRRVSFKFLDIYIPTPLDVFLQLHREDTLEGIVIHLSDDGTQEGQFVVVTVKGVTNPVIVPAHCVSEV